MPELDLSAEARPEIPNKLYFRIGEVSRLVGVKPYVLRYWETEFPALSPKKSGTGHRLYRRKEVEMLLEIKRLLYEKRFTIEGARRYLGTERALRSEEAAPVRGSDEFDQGEQGNLFSSPPLTLQDLRSELAAILEMLRE